MKELESKNEVMPRYEDNMMDEKFTDTVFKWSEINA